MSKKYRNRAKHQRGPHHGDSPPDYGKREVNMVYTVKIEPNPDQKDRDTAENTYRKHQIDASKSLNVISGVGAAIAGLALIALVVNAFLLHQQLDAARDSNVINKTAFDRAYRPYIGVNGVGVKYAWKDASGDHFSDTWRKEATNVAFRAEMKNFGPVPGSNYVGSWKIFYGGIQQVGSPKIPDKPFTFFPGQSNYLSGSIGYRDIVSETKTLVLEITYEYDGPSGHYKECEREQYAPNLSAFFDLGSCPS